MGHLRHRSLQVQELETTVLFADQEGDLDSAEQFFWPQLDHLRSFSLLVGSGAWLLWGLSWDVLCLFHVVSPSRRLARLVCVVTEEFSAVRERERAQASRHRAFYASACDSSANVPLAKAHRTAKLGVRVGGSYITMWRDRIY